MIVGRNRLLALGLSGVAVLSACSSQTAGDAGVGVVQEQLADQLDLGDLDDATCDEPSSEEIGEEFTCSATTDSGETVEFSGVMTADDAVGLRPSNLVLAEELDELSVDAVQVLAASSEVDPSTLSVDCPDETTFLDDADQIFCEITDASGGVTYELIMDLGPFDADEGFTNITYEVGEPVS